MNTSLEPPPAALHCPTCDAVLVQLDRSGIHIDACPRCRGIWLDRGELDRIVEEERRARETEIDADFIAEMRGRKPAPTDEERGGGRRRPSFLEDLFDFGG
jgi:Zn-finger nucleic acid-binding protein